MDIAQAVTADTVMKLLPGRPRVLALGEPTHGEDRLLDVRNGLFRQLVEREGYRTVAIESDCLRGLIVDDHVTTGAGTLDKVMERGFSHEFGASAANRELVRWMRAHNADRPAGEQVRFAGFDGPLEITGAESPRRALAGLHAYLAAQAGPLPCAWETLDRLLGADERWTEPAAMMEPSRSFGRSAEARELRLLADELVALLDMRTPGASREDWHRARLYGRTAVGLLRYHHGMADTSPGRMAWLLGIRGSMMAANLLALAERGPVLGYAHNRHLQRNPSELRLGDVTAEWCSAGALVSARLGEEYGFVATGVGAIRHRGVDAPPAGTVEGFLYTLPEECFVADVNGLAAALGETPPAARESAWYGYIPLDLAYLDTSDGILFHRDLPE
ncbi:erythromycin esterase family protein [Nonomuraea longicatena]|uniref:Erythromycin esterase family protein n=1 Tax=Nonomuraea longicatena TaxID=83682 RepID=A0ABP3ZT89_9ACTN